MRKLFLSCLLILFLTRLQAQNIIGDTIRVFDQAETSILFPKDAVIRDIQLTDKQGFSVKVNPGNKIMITAGAGAETCGMSLAEVKKGTQKKLRQHYFLLVHEHALCTRPDVLYHDLSTTEKIKARIRDMHEYDGRQVQRPATARPSEANAPPPTAIAAGNKPVIAIAGPEQEDTSMISLGGDLRISKEAFRQKAFIKTKRLSTFLSFLCNKANAPDACNEAIESALSLFINENVLIEVSSKTTGETEPKKVRTYLKDMVALRYSKVELSWSKLQYVGKLEMQPDSTLRGFVEFEQRFSGFLDQKIVYSDVTRKRVEVVLKLMKVKEGGDYRLLWDVLLSDIGVESTN
ncbi:hypothetical protein [Taibaiella koreensis]|uniref:hypothetical protein n=1 Tax=Taibaiella koreensis TaxID=1268548 RepID=UPI000E59FAB0|nr:hypothetical protein [Taibaiella koreensis]